MMKEQSLDFIVGYLFGNLDKSIFKHFYRQDKKGPLTVNSYCVPKTWFGLTSSKDVIEDIRGDVKYLLREAICNTLKDLYPKLEVYCERIVPYNQYIAFDFKIVKKPEVKKMTVSEVEAALGYKIEIVSDK